MIKNNLQDAKLLELSQILKRLLEYKKKYRYEEGFKELQIAYKQLLGLNGQLVEKLNTEDIISLISAHEAAEIYKLIILAKLLEAESDLYDDKRNISKALNIKLKSLQVINCALLLDKETTMDLSKESINELIDYLSSYEVNEKTYEVLIEHFEIMGSYDKAEDTFYDLLEVNRDNKEVIKFGLEFYSRLLNKNEEELEQGNFSLDEAREGLEYLRNL